MTPFTPSDMRQLDAIAERRVFDEAFDATHPELSESDDTRNLRARAFGKQKARRFVDDAPVTAFGELAS